MPIVGTAGHVDHGKSTLVEALTGRDPDRWAEEKERGLTIDLGFAWTELSPGVTVGFVDVPGHERFMKNMLAGVGAIDAALFVVATDEGWMPQTEEHLSVLDLLGVQRGVVALTRSDLADEDTVEIVHLEVTERLEGTGLEGWPVIAVSAVTGEGMDDLRVALRAAIEAAGRPADNGRPRLWVDRAFVVSGAGIVVTGTLTGGPITRGDDMELFPGPRVRVRGLQTHEQPVETAHPGTRTAVNLSGLDRDQVARGSVLAGVAAERPTRRVLADLRTVRSHTESLTARGAFHLHAGSGAWPARLVPVESDKIEQAGAVLIVIDDPVPLAVGDRFIVREVGRRAVVAGGVVLDPDPKARLAGLRGTLPLLRDALSGSEDDRAQALLEARGSADLDDLAVETRGGSPTDALVAERTALSRDAARRLGGEAERLVRDYQEENPLRPGAPKASLATRLEVSPEVLDIAVSSSAGLVDDGASVRTTGFSGALSRADESAGQEAERILRDAGTAAPRASQLGVEQELLHALIRAERLVQIADDLVYLPEQIEAIVAGLAALEDGFTVADFRDRYEISRRQAVPLLEWLDAAGYTRRVGDGRVVRRRPGREGSGAPPR